MGGGLALIVRAVAYAERSRDRERGCDHEW